MEKDNNVKYKVAIIFSLFLLNYFKMATNDHLVTKTEQQSPLKYKSSQVIIFSMLPSGFSVSQSTSTHTPT